MMVLAMSSTMLATMTMTGGYQTVKASAASEAYKNGERDELTEDGGPNVASGREREGEKRRESSGGRRERTGESWNWGESQHHRGVLYTPPENCPASEKTEFTRHPAQRALSQPSR